MKCTCKEVEPGLMKWDECCPEHGVLAQYFERERNRYLLEIKSAQHSVQRTAIAWASMAFFVGLFIGWFVFGG